MTPRIITDRAEQRGDFIPGDDGFYVYWPRGMGGALSADDLRQLAARLDELNTDWRATVDASLESETAQVSRIP